jgi:glutaredoxin
MAPEVRLVLYTRPGCHLCEVAAEELRGIGEPFTEVDITTDPALEIEYGERIPVIMLDGKEHGYWRVEKERLLRDLAQRRRRRQQQG